jgi:tetratricopeptide (TPR) repeat protein
MFTKIKNYIRSLANRLRGDQIDLSGNFQGSTIHIKPTTRPTIQVKPWAWIAGTIILASALILFAGIFNIKDVQSLLPTPLAFASAKDMESLIIVADFEDRSNNKYQGIDPAQYIYEELMAQAKKDKLNVRIERLRQIVDDNSVQSTGEVYSATLILWGWYDALTITPRIQRMKTLTNYQSTAEGQHVSLADPTKVELNIVTELPSQSAYIVFFTLALNARIDPNSNDSKTLTYFDSAIESIPENLIGSTNLAEAYLFRATFITEALKDYDRAIADYNKAIELNPNYAEAYSDRGVTYYYKNDSDQALADYNKAIELKPDFAIPYNNRGFFYYNKGEFERAIADFDKSIQLDPNVALTYVNRGGTYCTIGKYDLGAADAETAIRLKPDYAEAYVNRGTAFYQAGNFPLAFIDFTLAIKLKPDLAEAYNQRGLVYR